MELFSVTCTTCQQRLKVRDESVIGEIQICPKCGSMVLIHPPAESPVDADEAPPMASDEVPRADPVPPPIADLASEGGLTEASFSEDGPGEIDCSESAESPPAEPPLPETAALAAANPPQFSAASEQGIAVPPAREPAQEGDELTDALLLSADGGRAGISRNRYLWLWGAGAVFGGIALALGVFGLVASRALSSRQSEEPVPPRQGAGAEVAVEETEPADDAESESPSAASESGSPTAEDTAVESPPPTPAADGPGIDPPAADESAADTPTGGEPAGNPPGGPDMEASETEPAGGEAPSPPDAGGGSDDPDGTGIGQAGPAESPETPGQGGPNSGASASSLAETLDSFAPFIDPEAFVPPPGAPPAMRENAPELEANEDGGDVPDVPRPEPREVDVAQRLADEIPSIEFRDVPLKAFVRFLMGFSTIPITLDPDALALVGETSESRISVQQTGTTVGRALAAALQPLRLGVEVVDDQILVTRVASGEAALRTYPHPVDDLVAGDPARLAELANRIVDMVEPESWEPLGGEGMIRLKMPSLVIRQRETGLFRAILFCERLRTARGLPPRSGFDPSLFDLAPRFSAASEALARPVTLNYVEPTSFVGIVDQLSDESGLQILIDWRELAGLGWHPGAETTVSANSDPLGKVLGNLLRPMDLVYRVVGPTCIEVTSRNRLDTHLDVEFYPVADLVSAELTPDSLLAQLRAQLGEQVLDDVGATLDYDSPSGYLVVALPQPLQRRVLAQLEALRPAGVSVEGEREPPVDSGE